MAQNSSTGANVRPPRAASDDDQDPIDCLGYCGFDYFYRRRIDGRIFALHARDHTAPCLLALSAGAMFWYFDSWGDEQTDTIDWESVAAYLIGTCHNRGPYVPPAPGEPPPGGGA